MLVESIVALAACGAVTEWMVSRRDRALLRRIRDELSVGEVPPPLVLPVLFPSAAVAVQSESAVRSLGFTFRVDPDAEEIPGAGYWADVEARIPMSYVALRYARLRVQWAVRPQRGTVFDFESPGDSSGQHVRAA